MAEVKKQFEQALAFKERFEFRLTVGDDIICQRYFRIGNFNPISLRSSELTETIRGCAETIDKDLKSKSLIYLEIFAPRIFKDMEEFEKYIETEKNRMKRTAIPSFVVRVLLSVPLRTTTLLGTGSTSSYRWTSSLRMGNSPSLLLRKTM